ncbi:hypothetical protein VNO80_06301 [Phaseolus coccineus]|uniref:Uncharacterized protein n=1 Tax=Phaseolus coccineus TaxID=3886 RepID=A0AAN9NHU2_PHACN
MWDLNDPPDQWKNYECEGCSSSLNDDKRKIVGSSSPVVLHDGLEEKDRDMGGSRTLEKKTIQIFRFSPTDDDSDHPPVTWQQRSHSKGISRMWDLNDSPDQRKNYEYEDCSSSLNDDKGKREESVSNSSSSPVVLENGLEEEDMDKGGSRILEKKTIQIFRFSATQDDSDHPPVTRQ